MQTYAFYVRIRLGSEKIKLLVNPDIILEAFEECRESNEEAEKRALTLLCRIFGAELTVRITELFGSTPRTAHKIFPFLHKKVLKKAAKRALKEQKRRARAYR